MPQLKSAITSAGMIAPCPALGGASVLLVTKGGTGTPMAEISQRIFAAIIRHASGEKVRSEVLGYGNDEFLPWQVGAVM